MARVGPHVNRDWAPGARPPLAAHLRAAAAAALDGAGAPLGAAAVFVSNPRGLRLSLGPGEAAGLRAFQAETGVRLVAHSSYAAHPWGSPDARAFVRSELLACAEAGIGGLVVHLPKLPPAAVAAVAAELLEPGAPGVRVFLETPAVSPRESYYETPEKLGALFDALRPVDPGLERFGLCVDSAHLWTNGIDLASRGAAEAWLAGLEALGPRLPAGLVMFHLNDSARPRGRGPDKHAPLLAGEIWGAWAGGGAGACGLAAFADFILRHGSVAILERHEHADILADLLVLRDLGL